jgi:hypothetical protein
MVNIQLARIDHDAACVRATPAPSRDTTPTGVHELHRAERLRDQNFGARVLAVMISVRPAAPGVTAIRLEPSGRRCRRRDGHSHTAAGRPRGQRQSEEEEGGPATHLPSSYFTGRMPRIRRPRGRSRVRCSATLSGSSRLEPESWRIGALCFLGSSSSGPAQKARAELEELRWPRRSRNSRPPRKEAHHAHHRPVAVPRQARPREG